LTASVRRSSSAPLGEARPGLGDGAAAAVQADRQVHPHPHLRPLAPVGQPPEGVVGPHQLDVGIVLLLRQRQRRLLGGDAVGERPQVGPPPQGHRAQGRRVGQPVLDVKLARGQWQGGVGRQVHQGVDAGDRHPSPPLQQQAALALAAGLDVGLEDVLGGPLADAISILGVALELLQQAQALAVEVQGAVDEVVVEEGVAGGLHQLQLRVLDLVAGGAGLGQGVVAAQGELAAPGVLLGRLQAVAAVAVLELADGGRRRPRSEHGVVQGRDLRVARPGGLPGGDHLRQGGVAAQHLAHEGVG
jgi:hypothetical protein